MTARARGQKVNIWRWFVLLVCRMCDFDWQAQPHNNAFFSCSHLLVVVKVNNALYLQCSRADLNKSFLHRPKTTTAWKLTPVRSKISKNWKPPHSDPLHRFFQKLIFTNTKTALHQLHSDSFYLVKKLLMCRIVILADIRPMGYKLLCCGSIWSRLKLFI